MQPSLNVTECCYHVALWREVDDCIWSKNGVNPLYIHPVYKLQLYSVHCITDFTKTDVTAPHAWHYNAICMTRPRNSGWVNFATPDFTAFYTRLMHINRHQSEAKTCAVLYGVILGLYPFFFEQLQNWELYSSDVELFSKCSELWKDSNNLA